MDDPDALLFVRIVGPPSSLDDVFEAQQPGNCLGKNRVAAPTLPVFSTQIFDLPEMEPVEPLDSVVT